MGILRDNYFRDLTPAEIVTAVSTIGLATISLWKVDELIRVGWLYKDEKGAVQVSPFIDILYSMTSAGVWAARRNADGSEVADSVVRDYLNYAEWTNRIAIPPSVNGTRPSSGTEAANRIHATKIVPFATDGAGACAATPLHVGPAGYYPVIRLKRAICDTADAATTFTFTVTGGALVGPSAIVIALVANTVNEQMKDVLLYDLTDASTISCEISGGPASKTIYLEIEYWSET